MADDVLTKEDIAQLEKDTQAAKQILADSQLKQVKDDAKKEAEKEFKLTQELEEQRKAKQVMEQKLFEQEKALKEQADRFQKELDALKTTKSPVQVKNPFAEPSQQPSSSQAKYMSDEQKAEIERASMELFIQERSSYRL